MCLLITLSVAKMSFEEVLFINVIKTRFCDRVYGIKLLFCHNTKNKQFEVNRTNQIISNAVSPHAEALPLGCVLFHVLPQITRLSAGVIAFLAGYWLLSSVG